MKKYFSVLFALGLSLTFGSAYGANSAACLHEVVRDLSKQFPDNRTVNVVAFGHSVPAGYGKTPLVQTRVAYPRRIADAIADRYPTAVANVITSAVGGESSNAGRGRFENEALALKPRIVLIDYGLNDRMLSLQESEFNLQQMIRQAKNAGACVVLLTPSPDMNGDPPSVRSSLADQATMIRGLAGSEDVSLADVSARFDRESGRLDGLMAQPNHPNGEGHRLIAETVLELLK